MENASKALIIAGAILISILLITVGIILIRTGNDNVGGGVSEMNSQKIQAFNSKFTQYEGAQKGEKIKDLASVVRASNASSADYQVVLSINGATDAAGQPVTTLSRLSSTKTYNVEIVYAESSEDEEYSTGNIIVNPARFFTDNGYVMAVVISD